MPEIFDAIVLDAANTRESRDGYMLTDARIARTGIQTYNGSEIGRPEISTVRVYRPESEVFSQDAMASFAHRPITNDHPKELVTAATWKRHARGHSGSEIARDGDFIRVPLMLADADAIADVRAGKRELSAGYTCDLDFEPGVSDTGEPYDAVMRNLRGNHIAIVARGRAGPECRIGDGDPPEQTQGKPMKTTMIDGHTVEVADEAVAVIEATNTRLTDAIKRVDTLDGEVSALRSAHDAALALKDVQIAALNAQTPTAAALDAAIEARAAVIDAARSLVGSTFEAKGMTDSAIKRSVVTTKLGDAKTTGRSDEWIGAAFDTLTALPAQQSAADPLRDAIRDHKPTNTATIGMDAYTAHLEWLRNEHKTKI